jgi:hydrogenase maturation factor
MSAYFPKFLEAKYGRAFVKKAQDVYYQMSTVKDALIAASVGSITAMHDATECGVFGGLYEMSVHSKIGMRIYLDDMILQEEVKKTCECFDIDPYIAISEGTLLATANRKKTTEIIRSLKCANIPASVVGEAVPYKEGVYFLKGNKKQKLTHPKTDPFWLKFEEFLKK